MLTALLFDLDGTLVETDSTHFRIWQSMLREHGLEIDRAFYKARISGRLNPDIVAELLPQLSSEAQAQFIWQKEATFRNQADALEPLAGLPELLVWANQQQLRQAIVTNTPRENADFMLQALGLSDHFATVVLGDDLPQGKPDPLPYQEALRRLKVTAAEAIAFEDSPSGICSAVAAGIYTIGIASTHDPQVLSALGAALVVPDFTDPRLTDLLHQRASEEVAAPCR